MAETEAKEFTLTLDELTTGRQGIVIEGDHPLGGGEYDFTHGFHVRTDGARKEAAITALTKSHEEVTAGLGGESLRPSDWGNVLSTLSFTNLVRIAADSSLVAEKDIPQEKLRKALFVKAGHEAVELASARQDILTEQRTFRPRFGNANADELKVGISILNRFQNELLEKGSYYGIPQGRRV